MTGPTIPSEAVEAGWGVFSDGAEWERSDFQAFKAGLAAAAPFIAAQAAEAIADKIAAKRDDIGPTQVFAWTQGMNAAAVIARSFAAPEGDA